MVAVIIGSLHQVRSARLRAEGTQPVSGRCAQAGPHNLRGPAAQPRPVRRGRAVGRHAGRAGDAVGDGARRPARTRAGVRKRSASTPPRPSATSALPQSEPARRPLDVCVTADGAPFVLAGGGGGQSPGRHDRVRPPGRSSRCCCWAAGARWSRPSGQASPAPAVQALLARKLDVLAARRRPAVRVSAGGRGGEPRRVRNRRSGRKRRRLTRCGQGRARAADDGTDPAGRPRQGKGGRPRLVSRHGTHESARRPCRGRRICCRPQIRAGFRSLFAG